MLRSCLLHCPDERSTHLAALRFGHAALVLERAHGPGGVRGALLCLGRSGLHHLPILEEAQAWAELRVSDDPALRCRIYDHEGFAGQPAAEVRGAAYKAEPEMSPRFRRWFGSTLFLGGLLLTAYDWLYGFRFSWAAMIGTRLLLPGLLLLFIEAMVMLHASRQVKGNHTARRAV